MAGDKHSLGGNAASQGACPWLVHTFDLIAGDVTPHEDRARFEEHLEGCSVCQSQLETADRAAWGRFFQAPLVPIASETAPVAAASGSRQEGFFQPPPEPWPVRADRPGTGAAGPPDTRQSLPGPDRLPPVPWWPATVRKAALWLAIVFLVGGLAYGLVQLLKIVDELRKTALEIFRGEASTPEYPLAPVAGDYGSIGPDTPVPEPVHRTSENRFVPGAAAAEPGNEVGPRFYVYQDEAQASPFIPNGWMPDGLGISQNPRETDAPHSPPHCLRIGCQLSAKPWVAGYFLLGGTWEPEQSFNLFERLGAKPGDAIRCRFWARSKDRGSVQFRVGGVTKGKIKDSLKFPVLSLWVRLEPDWKMYEIDLTGKDLHSLVGGFSWVCDRQHNEDKDVRFDLDTIYFVKVALKPGQK